MRITKFTHSCVRLENAGRVLVIDPGVWSEAGALLGADAVLVTHEHADHVDTVRLAGIGVPVFAPEGADLPGLGQVRGFDLVRVGAGDEFDAAGFRVEAVGGFNAATLTTLAIVMSLLTLLDITIFLSVALLITETMAVLSLAWWHQHLPHEAQVAVPHR